MITNFISLLGSICSIMDFALSFFDKRKKR